MIMASIFIHLTILCFASTETYEIEPSEGRKLYKPNESNRKTSWPKRLRRRLSHVHCEKDPNFVSDREILHIWDTTKTSEVFTFKKF